MSLSDLVVARIFGEVDSVTSSSSDVRPSPSKARHEACEERLVKVEAPDDSEIPDPAEWSSVDVYQYFSNHFQPHIAAAFQEQVTSL